MDKYIKLALVTIRNRMKEEVRYPVQFIFNSLMFVGIAYVLSFGSIAVQKQGNLLASMSGFFLAFLAGAAITQPLEYMGNNKLDDFYLRPISSIKSILFSAIGRAIELIVTLSLYILPVCLIKQEDLVFLLRFVIVSLPVFISMLGIGLMVAGVRLIFVKVGALPQILWIALIGIALGAQSSFLNVLSYWLNFAGGLLYLKTGELDWIRFLIILAATIIIGLIVFKRSELFMLRNGLIGQE